MKLFYDNNDSSLADKLGSKRLYWLDEIGAIPIQEANPKDKGFLFGFDRGIKYYKELLKNKPNIFDKPKDREELTELHKVILRLQEYKVDIPMPKTWILYVDDNLPKDITFPLFVRTTRSSWKRAGKSSYVKNRKNLNDEMYLLRQADKWDAIILARSWLDLAVAGYWRNILIPQEIRIWIIDNIPFAWSFHHAHIIPNPHGIPPNKDDLYNLKEMAYKVGSVFQSRLIVADFVKLKNGKWSFLECDPGSCAGTAHEKVFKSVALKLANKKSTPFNDTLGGIF